jgi:glycosyltransferase involved in cell wall biosynthesis
VPEPRVAIAYDCLFPVNGGGGERVYRRLAEDLVGRGASVAYVTRAQWAADAPPRASFDLVGVWRGDIYDAAGTRRQSSAVRFALALFRHFVRHRRDYDLVVVAALPVLNVFAVRLALLGRPTTLVVDWLEVWGRRKWREYAGLAAGSVASLLQWLALRVRAVHTVNSRFTAARVRASRPGADPLVLGLVDLVGEQPSADAEGDRAPLVLFVGRHIPDKRLDVLPAAIAHARSAIPGLRARIVGDGPETDRVRAITAELGLDDDIDFLGRVDDDTLQRSFAEAAVLVNPSAREGFGLVVAEAAAAATPSVVVAGADNAAAGLIEPGVNGLVAADTSPAVLGDAIVEVVRGGAVLRRSTLAWFERERVERGLGRSIDELLARAGLSAR